MWYRLQEILFARYDQIKAQALKAQTLFADETGWRVKGKTWWLLCFTTGDLTYYLIDRCRGSPLLRKFFKRQFQGILISDFWGAYNANRSAAGADRQAVLRSIFRTLKQRGHNPLQTIVQALRTYLLTGQLPPLPDKVAADG